MKYNPQSHHRRSVRLRGYDYSSPGAYYVTVCTLNKDYSFGRVVNSQMHVNSYGEVAREEWFRAAELRRDVTPDAFIVMPNHIHGIIVRTRPGQTRETATTRTGPAHEQFGKLSPGALSALVRAYKSAVTARINRMRGAPGAPVWQRGFYEHVVRNDGELNRIRQYILTNPLRWDSDRYNPDCAPMLIDEDEFDV